MKPVFVCCALLSTLVLAAQNRKLPVHFRSYNAIGLLAGKSPVELSVQSVNGFQWKGWFAGAGVALDAYEQVSFPIFLDVKRELKLNKVQLFVYGDIGTQWIKPPKNNADYYYKFERTGGLYLDGGAGIRIPTSKKNSLFFTFGNTFKRVTYTESSKDINSPYSNTTVYGYSRLCIRAGFQF